MKKVSRLNRHANTGYIILIGVAGGGGGDGGSE